MTTTQQPNRLAGEVLPDYDHDEFPPPAGSPALRATAFFRGSAHPDAAAAACPAWCVWLRDGEDHGIEYGQPFAHSSTTLETRASFYRGVDEDARHRFASFETRVEMINGREPEISVALRDYPPRRRRGRGPELPRVLAAHAGGRRGCGRDARLLEQRGAAGKRLTPHSTAPGFIEPGAVP